MNQSQRTRIADGVPNVPLSLAVLSLSLIFAGATTGAWGQQTAPSAQEGAALDAQTETNVVIALDSWTALKGQQIAASTLDGDVTLTGSVKDDASKALAERVAQRIAGVRSVRDNLTVAATVPAAASAQDEVENRYPPQAPELRQSSTELPAEATLQEQAQAMDNTRGAQAQQPAPYDAAPTNTAASGTASRQDAPPPQNEAHDRNVAPSVAPDQPQSSPRDNPAYPSDAAPGTYADQTQSAPSQGAANRAGSNNYPQDQQTPPAPRRPYDRDTHDRGTDDPSGYGEASPDRASRNQDGYNAGNPEPRTDQHNYDRPYNRGNGDPAQDDRYERRAARPVTLPAATILRVRTSEFLDARRLQPGSPFEVTAANDVFVGRVLAVPRGATLHGVVTDLVASNSGSMTGSSSLTLKLTDLNLEGRSYPLNTETWTAQGPGKGAYSANNTIGGAAIGAVIGAIVGRGPGAAIGAVAGGATGAAASSASAGPRMVLAPETILTFHLTEPLTVDPVSSREAQRLASAGQAQGRPYLRPRPYYPPPPPPPPYYYGQRVYFYGPRW